MKYLFSNEIVFRGHPDKVCDQIGDAILTEHLRQDPLSRCGIEVTGGKGILFITGEITSLAQVDIELIAKRVLRDVGYDDSIDVIVNIGKQSPDIALGTNEEVLGAGDQGMMFGFATRETPERLPAAQVILQKFAQRYDQLVHNTRSFLPDGKAQITGEYSESDSRRRLLRIKKIVISYQNTEKHRTETDQIIKDLFIECVNEVNPDLKVDEFLINPTGKFLIGGFEGDAGVLGRKIVVDSYQGFAAVGGGAFSGKDPTKVDRSAAYYARKVAKDLLEEHNADWVDVQVAYAIGRPQPVSISLNSSAGTLIPSQELYDKFTPESMIKELNLREWDYEELAKFGHFIN